MTLVLTAMSSNAGPLDRSLSLARNGPVCPQPINLHGVGELTMHPELHALAGHMELTVQDSHMDFRQQLVGAPPRWTYLVSVEACLDFSLEPFGLGLLPFPIITNPMPTPLNLLWDSQ